MAKFCVYTAQQSAPNLKPPVKIGDTICVACPADGVCKGTQGQAKGIKIKDEEGNTKKFKLILMNTSCTDCPAGGLQGYQFAPEDSGGGSGW